MRTFEPLAPSACPLVTLKSVELVALPSGVVTRIFPVAAPAGTLAEI